jgi:hypothetical protein
MLTLPDDAPANLYHILFLHYRIGNASLKLKENTFFLPRLYPVGSTARPWIAAERLFGEQTALC